MRVSLFLGALFSASVAVAQVNTIKCNGKQYTYQSLAGYGFVPGNAYDRFSDTLGGLGSSMAIPKSSWKQTGNAYSGILWALPDRGWNTQGTTNFQPRVHKFRITFTPQPNATLDRPSGPNVQFSYLDTVLFSDPSGEPMTGLDADGKGTKGFPGFPRLPISSYTGDGFGRPGTGGQRVPLDSEGLVVLDDGTFWVSDEYGPYVYHFSSKGQMMHAIRPPPAIIPRRNGTQSFSADSPPIYDTNQDDDVIPADPQSGRDNNHGFEGLTVSPDGKTLYVLLQEAAIQDGGSSSSTSRHVRFFQYDISGENPLYEAEYVVPLAQYADGTKNKTAAQSEFHYISPTQFLVLGRDGGAGNGQDSTESLYRHADVFDISKATNVKGKKYDCRKCAVAPGGVLDSSITAATYCPFLDYNDNSQLGRFGVHNGGATDAGLLNEKWESFALVPVNGDGSDGEFFLFSMSDNDFITQNGFADFGTYAFADDSGFNLDNQLLVFQVKLPKGSKPI